MTESIVILGAGGFAQQLPSLVRDINSVDEQYNIVGFLAPEGLERKESLPILGTDQRLHDIGVRYAIGIGIPRARASLDKFASQLGRDTVTLVHPQSGTQMNVKVGPGCVIMAGARLNTGTSLGRHVLVNANVVIGHDCEIDDHAVLHPLSMLAGGVRVGQRVLIGASAVVLSGRTIGDDSVIGAGAVVTTDVPPGVCAMGVPSRWRT